MRIRIRAVLGMSVLLSMVGTAFPLADAGTAYAKGVSAKISARTVKVGKRIRITSRTDSVSYKSSDTTVASVGGDGVITGKKAGTAKITVSRKGYQAKTYPVTVKADGKKPAELPVTFSEVMLKDVKLQASDDGDGMVYSARIKNIAKKGKIKKIIYCYEIERGGGGCYVPVDPAATATPDPSASGTAISGGAASSETAIPGSDASGTSTSGAPPQPMTVKLTAKNIKAGRTSPRVQCRGDYRGELSAMKLLRIDLYAGSALYRYDAVKGTYSLKWGAKDTTAPRITGLVKGSSYTGLGDAYRTYYSDMKGNYNFKWGVSAVDDRDGKVKVQVDTSGINWNRTGAYRLLFQAKDKAGNVATSWAKVQVYVPGASEAAADKVLRSVTRKGWSDQKKARAIYRYVRGRTAYVHSSSHTHWRTAALRGLRYQSGDCYTYYAISRLLLTRAGITNVMIKRYPTTYGRHFWNLAYVNGGWYHFDTTPRSRGGKFCLLTDAQLWGYSSGYTFRFQQHLYPKRAAARL